MYRIKIDRSRCIGCLTCVTACVVSHESCDARNRVVIDSESKCAPIFCRHCEKPEKCASCYMCIMACPYGVLKSDRVEHKEIMKCNMCVHRTQDGSPAPMCVEICPMGAITLEEVKG